MKTFHLVTLSSLAWLATGACSPDMQMQLPGHHYARIKADGLPPGSYLRFKPRLDGRRAEQMDLSSNVDVAEVRFDLLSMDVGRFAVDAVAVGVDGWPTAEGHTDVDVSAGDQTVTATLKLVPVDQAVCVPAANKMDRWCQVEATQKDLNLQAIHGTDSDNIWAVGSVWSQSLGRVVGSIWHWNGFRWRQEKTPSGKTQLAAVWASNYDEAWAAGESNGSAVIWRWNAHDQLWSDVDSSQNEFSTTPPLKVLWGSSANDIWAAGGAMGPSSDDLPVWHWDGRQWNKTKVGSASSIRDIWGADATHVWMVGEKDTVLQWNGIQWERPLGIPSNTGKSWSSVWVSPSYNVSITDGYEYLLRLNGGKWALDRNPKADNPSQLRGICRAAGDCELWGIKSEQLVQLTAGGWMPVDKDREEGNLNGLWALGPSSIWAAGDSGRIWEVTSVGDVKKRIDRHSPPSGYYINDILLDDQKRLWVFADRAWRWDGWRWVQIGKKAPAALQSIVFNNEKDIWASYPDGNANKLGHWTGDGIIPSTWTDFTPMGMPYKGFGTKRFTSNGKQLIYPIIHNCAANCPGFAVLSGSSWGNVQYVDTVTGTAAQFAASCALTTSEFDSCVVIGTGVNDGKDLLWVYNNKWTRANLSGAELASSSRIVDMQSLAGTGLIWVALSDYNNTIPISQIALLQKQGDDWMLKKFEDLRDTVASRLLVKSMSEVWIVGSAGLVWRSNGGETKAQSTNISFDTDQKPSLRAIAVGDRNLRQVWVADDKGILWRMARP